MWFGLESAVRARQPNHYLPLGLAPFESDAMAIEAAANRRAARLAHVQVGAYEPLRRQLLTEVEQAPAAFYRILNKNGSTTSSYGGMTRRMLLRRQLLKERRRSGVTQNEVQGLGCRSASAEHRYGCGPTFASYR